MKGKVKNYQVKLGRLQEEGAVINDMTEIAHLSRGGKKI